MLRIIGVLIASLLILSTPVFAEPEANEGEELKRWEADMERQAHSIELQKRQFELEKQRTRLEHSKKQFRAQNKNWKPDLRKDKDNDKGDRHHYKKWDRKSKGCKFFLFWLFVLNISLVIIVLKDMKSDKNALSGLWVFIVLIGSIPAAVAYALFRLIKQREN